MALTDSFELFSRVLAVFSQVNTDTPRCEADQRKAAKYGRLRFIAANTVLVNVLLRIMVFCPLSEQLAMIRLIAGSYFFPDTNAFNKIFVTKLFILTFNFSSC